MIGFKVKQLVKDEVKKQLLLHKGEYLSGGELSAKLNVTRNAVWKAIKQLKDEGYEIEGISNRGYRLNYSDVLEVSEIERNLHTAFLGKTIQILKSVDSTNNYCKALAQQGAPQGLVVLAEQQTEGRGRLGKTFSSPSGKGIYMSIVLRPGCSFEKLPLITIASALAVCHVLESSYGLKPGIKWVNDIFIGGRKICGILTEASIEAESGSLSSVINGIGINVNTDIVNDLPPEVSQTAQSLYQVTGRQIDRNRLIGEILTEMERCYNLFFKQKQDEMIAEYRSRLFMLGKTVTVTENDQTYPAEAIDIDSAGRLIVRNAAGELKTLHSGEISIRL